MGELKQYHPGLKFSSIKTVPKGDFVTIGDSLQDVLILQSETKIKATSGQKVKISLPKPFQTSKVSTKNLVIKGVLTDTETEFKEFFDHMNTLALLPANYLTLHQHFQI